MAMYPIGSKSNRIRISFIMSFSTKLIEFGFATYKTIFVLRKVVLVHADFDPMGYDLSCCGSLYLGLEVFVTKLATLQPS